MKLRPPESKHVDYQSGRSRNPSMTNQEWWPAHYEFKIAEWKQNIADRERDVEDKRRAMQLYDQTTNKQLGAMMKSADSLIKGVPEYVSSKFDPQYRTLIEGTAKNIMHKANPYVDERGQSYSQPSVTHTFGGMYDDDEDTVMGETFTPRDDSGAPPPVTVQPGAGIPTDAEGDMNWESDPVATDMPVEGDMNWGDYTDPEYEELPPGSVDPTGTGAETTGADQRQDPPANIDGRPMTFDDLSVQGIESYNTWLNTWRGQNPDPPAPPFEQFVLVHYRMPLFYLEHLQ